MSFLKQYIEYGKKTLTSGLESDKYYNFRKLTEEHKLGIAKWLEKQAEYFIIVAMTGISYEIAKLTNNLVIWYDPHKNDIENKAVLRLFSYVVFDDVITTFGTIRKCILKVGKLPKKVLCIKNRMNIIEFIKE